MYPDTVLRLSKIRDKVIVKSLMVLGHLPLVKHLTLSFFFLFVTRSIAGELSSQFYFIIKQEMRFYEKVRLTFLCVTANLKESPTRSKQVLNNGSAVGAIGFFER